MFQDYAMGRYVCVNIFMVTVGRSSRAYTHVGGRRGKDNRHTASIVAVLKHAE